MSPSSLTLLLDSALGSLGTEVVGDDGAGVLHVQEVGGQRPLGGVGVVSALLALLLLLNSGGHLGRGDDELGGGIVKVAEQVQLGVVRGVLAEEQVGLADVVLGEVAEQIQDGGEATDSLETSQRG